MLFPALARAADAPGLLRAEDFRHYVDALNRSDPEDVNGGISNAEAWAWMTRNVPYLACPDSDLELTYYYRWWAYRKHIEKTGAGYVITEFLRPVKHSTDYNAISCALGLHIAEGRWLHDARYLDGYVDFWLHSGEGGGFEEHFHQFSGWLADALYDRWLADGNRPRLLAQFAALRQDYAAWEKERLTASGLFWQRDVSDGMESSISGGRNVKNLRPTINSYMYANARALAAIAGMAGDARARAEYDRKAAALRKLTQERFWNPKDQFFERCGRTARAPTCASRSATPPGISIRPRRARASKSRGNSSWTRKAFTLRTAPPRRNGATPNSLSRPRATIASGTARVGPSLPASRCARWPTC